MTTLVNYVRRSISDESAIDIGAEYLTVEL